jgi:DNA mismatch endonuclease (patch repair protein)
MSRIKSKNTKIEVFVFRELRRAGVHFQKHYKRCPGRPDVCVPSRKLAVFIDGDFWHGYRYPAWKHKLPSEFWTNKIERNRARDRKNFSRLRRSGWRVMRVWEHELQRHADQTTERIIDFLVSSGSN